jgi:hypothetical protein
MSHPAPSEFDDLAQMLDLADDVRSAALAAAEFAGRHLGADIIGVAMHEEDGRIVRLVQTSPLVAELYAIDAPAPWTGLGALPTRYISDTRTSQQFKDFSRDAAKIGVRSVMSIAMGTLRGRLVSVDLFAHDSRAFGHTAEQLAAALNVLQVSACFERVERMQDAVQARLAKEQSR